MPRHSNPIGSSMRGLIALLFDDLNNPSRSPKFQPHNLLPPWSSSSQMEMHMDFQSHFLPYYPVWASCSWGLFSRGSLFEGGFQVTWWGHGSSHVPPGFANGSSVPAGIGSRQVVDPYKYVPNGTNFLNLNVKLTPRMQGNVEVPNSTTVNAYRRQHDV